MIICFRCEKMHEDDSTKCPNCGFFVTREDMEQVNDLKNASMETKELFYNAMRGDAQSINKVGVFYYTGNGDLEKSYDKAFLFFKKAVLSDFTAGYFNLGICYYYGHGVDKDITEATRLLSIAEERGHKGAKKALIVIESQNPSKQSMLTTEQEKALEEQKEIDKRLFLEEQRKANETNARIRARQMQQLAKSQRDFIEAHKDIIDKINEGNIFVYHEHFGKGKIVSFIENKYVSILFDGKKGNCIFSIALFNDKLFFEKPKKIEELDNLLSNKYYAKENELEREHFEKIEAIVDKRLRTCEDSVDLMSYEFNQFDPANDKVTGRSRIELTSLVNDLRQVKLNPYFTKIDYTENGKEQSLYIGKTQFEDYIADWRDKRSGIYYQRELYYNNEKINLSLIRHFDIENGRYICFKDSYTGGDEDSIEYEDSDCVDKKMIDLLKESRQNKSIHDIITTIQKNQYNMISWDYNDNIVVNGCAGSGKTMILFHRIAYIAFNKPSFKPENVYVVAPNKFLLNDFKELSNILKLHRIHKMSFLDLYNHLIQSYSLQSDMSFKRFHSSKLSSKSEFSTEATINTIKLANEISNEVFNVFKRSKYTNYMALLQYFYTYSTEGITNQIENCLEPYIDSLNETIWSLHYIEEAKKERFEAIEKRNEYHFYLETLSLLKDKFSHLFKGKRKNKSNIYSIFKVCNEIDSIKSAFHLSPKHDPSFLFESCEEFYKILDKYEGLEKMLVDEGFEILQAIIKYATCKVKGSYPEDFYLEEENAFIFLSVLYNFYGPLSYNDIYMCIDEFQNYSPHEFQIINKVYPNAIFNLYGDYSQRINPRGLESIADLKEWGEGFKEFYINENYRNAYEITQFVNSEFNMNMTPIGISGTFEYVGRDKLSFSFNNEDRIALIYKNEEELSKLNLDSTIVNYLEKSGTVDRSKLNVLSISMAKGLEFEDVYVLDTDMTRNERYVAYTRALSKLGIIR